MSDEPGAQLITERGQAGAGSVFDFLYYDAERVGSFLAQFDPKGVLQSLKHASSVADSNSAKTVLVGGGTIGIANLRSTGEKSSGEEAREAAERTFDPLWTNARAFLDFLDERNLIHREVGNARMGQFVVARGNLSVLDNTLVAGAWKLETFKTAMLAGSDLPDAGGTRQQRRAQGRSKHGAISSNPIEMALELMTLLPHAVQARIDGDTSVWCSLKKEGLITSASDLLLKHGVTIPGEWAMLGILDAFPDTGTESDVDPDDLTHGVVSLLVTLLAGPTRFLLGRPSYAYGMTPLLIFREVAG